MYILNVGKKKIGNDTDYVCRRISRTKPQGMLTQQRLKQLGVESHFAAFICTAILVH